MRKRITAGNVESFPEGAEVWDAILPGLILRVGRKRKTWQVRVQAFGRQHRQALGHYPNLGIAEARDKAREVLNRLEAGIPLPKTIDGSRGSSNGAGAGSNVLTVGGLIDQYEMMRKREGKRIKSLDHAMSTLRKELGSLLRLPATELTKADVREVRDRIVDRGALTCSNRFLSYLGPVLRWAAQEDLIETNFIPDIRKSRHERSRDRVLEDAEIRALWHASEGADGSYGPFCRLVRFLLVTAQRKGEARDMRWEHVEEDVWHQHDNKSSRPHDVPLTSLAQEIMGEPRTGLVFHGKTGSLQGFSKLKEKLDTESGVTDWGLHDLRRTASTGMQRQGIAEPIIRAVLNHRVPGIGEVYLRDQLETQKREALQMWADRILSILE
jgi:integrase